MLFTFDILIYIDQTSYCHSRNTGYMHWSISVFALLCIFCRFPETLGEFHDDMDDGLVSICRKLLLKAFPSFDVSGYEVLRSAAPVLYMGQSAKDIGLYVCSQVMCDEQNQQIRCTMMG